MTRPAGLKVSLGGNSSNFAIYTINSLSANAEYYAISVSYAVGNSSFSNGNSVVISFIRTGDAGAIGATGSTGATGPTGSTGAKGTFFVTSDTPPASPSQGDSWYNSATGKSYIYYDNYWIEIAGY